ncbi:alpha/beta hydrolase [Streptomyces sp. SR27]|uniref:alpha/beta fold hydrolase n=1 Tax=Streptomyces sp. SR27 TaxID=3076630 RepID=UPI00295B874B|nr:alpha/beta hydrolase [Streptomyces sp. SR27]MDV9192505.1 alpha/beta hydrolase [Streptomyces sp. SR27]
MSRNAKINALLLLVVAALALLPKERVWQAMCWLDSRGEEPDTDDAPQLAGFLRRRWMRTRIAQLSGAGRLLLSRQDGTAQLTALRMPLHMAYGADEMVWSTADLAATAARTGAHHTVVAGAGHSPNVSHPRELADRLTEFWERPASELRLEVLPETVPQGTPE